ncbi:hypothetical protein BRD00_15045 [Halobacteriales archaeon QS_8_69_26]|nr:MAG: hypothetical protein BRD00_15045 [Halobacteriales archaeon QS_8_69_26]
MADDGPDRRPDDGGPDGNPPWSFEEVQRFRQHWLWAFVGAVSVFAVVTVLVQRPGPVVSAVLLALPVVGVVGTYRAGLHTEVREDGLSLQLSPLQRSPRHVPFEDVLDHERVEFRAFRDYGGIGIRRTPGEWAYVVTSGTGVRIDRGDEEPNLMVGTKRPEALERALAAGVARSKAAVGGDDQPRWKAVANVDPGDPGNGENPTDGTATDTGADGNGHAP